MKNNPAKTRNLLIVITIIAQVFGQINENKLTITNLTADDWFGYSDIALAGNHLLAGAIKADGATTETGVVYSFERDGLDWVQNGRLFDLQGEFGDNFGYSVSISGDYAIIGVNGDDSQGNSSGSARIYHFNSFTWNADTVLIPDDGAAHTNFGMSVDIDGNYAIVGASRDDDNGARSGSAYIYRRDGDTWTQEFKLLANDGVADDYFGEYVAISNDHAVVGAIGDDDGGNLAGAAYIFQRNDTTWSQVTKLLANDGTSNNYFGYGVDIDGPSAIIGAYTADNAAGAAYIFSRTGNTWSQELKLSPADLTTNDFFGSSVAISGSFALVGCKRGDGVTTGTGTAYLYEHTINGWDQHTKLNASDGDTNDNYGRKVSIDGPFLAVASPFDDAYGSASGSAYTYSGYLPYSNIAVNPDFLDFGDVLVGSVDSLDLAIIAAGSDTLEIFNIEIDGVDSNSFAVTDFPVNILPGDSAVVTVIFSPADTIVYSATITIQSNGGNLEITLSGIGIAPRLSVDITMIDYGYVNLNDTIVNAVTFYNTGNAKLNIAALQFEGDSSVFFITSSDSFSIELADSAVLEIGFSPNTINEFNDTLFISSDGGNAAIPLNGSGALPILMVTTDSLNFQNQIVGDTSALNLSIINSGPVPLNMLNIAIDGDTTSFWVETPLFNLNPQQSSTITVYYSPANTGIHWANLLLESDGGSTNIELSGNGVFPEIIPSNDVLDFGPVTVFSSAVDTLSLINGGTSGLIITELVLAGNSSDVLHVTGLPNLPISLDVNASANIAIGFTPPDTLIYRDTLIITSNAGNVSIPLVGIGTAALLAFMPEMIDFGSVYPGHTETLNLEVVNVGQSPLTVLSLDTINISSPSFSFFYSGFELPLVLNPADTLSIEMSFIPWEVGPYSGSIVIYGNGFEYVVPMTGQGVDATAIITTVEDIPDDQGGWVYLTWSASSLDSSGGITRYGILEQNSEDEWIALGSIPAMQNNEYTFAAHTFGDSTIDGTHWSKFIVTTHTPDPELFYTSAVDSGYSIDNLWPTVPTGLIALNVSANSVTLSWESSPDVDFRYFNIYRSTDGDFDSTGIEPLISVIDTFFIDSDLTGAASYYRVSAVDFSGNESGLSDVVMAIFLNYDNPSNLPVTYALYQNYPNPFNPITTLRYALPEQSDIKITIYDLLGKQVRSYTRLNQAAGYHSVSWNGTNNSGHQVSAGVYLYRIEAGSYIQTKKMILLK